MLPGPRGSGDRQLIPRFFIGLAAVSAAGQCNFRARSSSPPLIKKDQAMAATRNVAVLIGSLRKDSLNRKMANALIGLAPPELKLSIVEIGTVPLYNQDHDANPPAAVTDL